MAHFHHFSICNQNQSISILVIFVKGIAFYWPKLLIFITFQSAIGQNTKAIALLLGQYWLIFITFQSAIKINQFQFGHFSLICGQTTKAIALLFGQNGSFSSLFNLQSKSINFNFGHFSLMFGQNTKAIALLFGQNWLIFITFQSAIKINQFQFFAHFWPKYQGYSLTFWHKIGSFSSLFNLQSKSIISISVIWLIFGQTTKAIALLFGQKWLIFITFQSAIKINQFQFWSFFAHFWPNYQGYSLSYWPKLAHFHHFSICNQNQSMSVSVIFRSFVAKIPRL